MPRKGRRHLWRELPVELTFEEKPESEVDDLSGSDETIETTSITEIKEVIDCYSFSDDNKNVEIDDEMYREDIKKGIYKPHYAKGHIRLDGDGYNGYCFLDHPKIENNQILKWSIRIWKMRGDIGPVNILY